MTELIRLQDTLSRTIARRFERQLALAFSDIVGLRAYFTRFGDEAGRQLMQRHSDLIQRSIAPEDGRLVDALREGSLLCFDNADRAVRAMIALQRAAALDNEGRRPEHHLRLRVGVHHGPVLTDAQKVSGDAVNVCGLVLVAADAGELLVSQDVFIELRDPGLRLRAKRRAPIARPGMERSPDKHVIEWRDAERFPATVRFEDGSTVRLPDLDVIRFGRMRELDGIPANDIVILPPDPRLMNRISRWHFELHRRAEGMAIRSVSTGSTTECEGRALVRGEEMMIQVGARVRLGGVVTLEFASDPLHDEVTRIPQGAQA